MCMILSQTVVMVLIYSCAQTCPAQNKIFQVEEDAMLIICTIDEKISQPDRRLSRAGLPTALYASLAATSKESSTHRIESSRETGICIWSASITGWSTIIWQSSAGAAGTVNPCLGVEPDMLDFSAWGRILWLFQYLTNLSSWFCSIFGHSQ